MKVYKTTDGAWQINYRTEGKQKQIYLGVKHTQASANRIGGVIRELLLCRYRDEMPGPDLLEKVRRFDSKLKSTIKRHGILDYCDSGVTLGELIDRFMELKQGLKPQSVKAYETNFKTIRDYFGTKKIAVEITEDDAVKFKAYMLADLELSPVTVSARICNYRSMFRYAIRKKYIYSSPFEDVVGGPDTNDSRYRFVERETIENVLSQCEDEPLKFAVRLARYAGLRMPSEIRYMKFSDFGTESFFVQDNTKTGRREIPFFHELRPHFFTMKRLYGENEYVFPRVLMNSNNIWRVFKKLLIRTGTPRWPRQFNNLRASCVTEYDEMGFNEKTLDSIFGNTEQIRKRHYVGFRKDRAFMAILGTKKLIVDELVSVGGVVNSNIETEKIDLMIRYLESLKVSQSCFEAEEISTE